MSESENIDEDIEKMESQRRLKEQIGNEKGVAGREITEEMEKSYIDYAMSVIVQRALPAAEDGLKPVHRRILYAMHQVGLTPDKPTKKSATVVGEVLGKFHPHGDTAVYDAMVRMAQDFSMRYPLVKGQGNFGSMDGDSPAAMRYTEAKLAKISGELLKDIEKETVEMQPNFDNSVKEPVTVPGLLPNLLLNGATGIAVGMATNIPPHNLTELCNAVVEYINKPEINDEQLMDIVTGPDFPTGGYVTGPGIQDMYKTGKGKLIMRGRTKIENKLGKSLIVITEIPYMVNKSDLVKDIARLATEKKLPDVSDLRDESAKGEVRIVIELKKDTDPKFTLNKLYKLTKLQTNFDANILALVKGKPTILPLKDYLKVYVDYRKKVVTKRSEFELNKAEERLEIVLGLLIALNNIDAIVDLIKKAGGTKEAADSLMTKFKFSERQVKAVLEMRLQQLTRLEDGKLKEEESKLNQEITYLKKILSSEQEILGVVKKEITELKKNYGDERRTSVLKKIAEIKEKDLIQKKEVVVTLTHSGYIKRLDLQTYKEQRRGGAGVSGTGLKEEDFVTSFLTCNTHDYLLFFTSRGRIYWLKANDVPDAGRQSKGRSMANLLNLRDEDIANVMAVKDFEKGYLMFATTNGIVKKINLKEVSKPRSTGVRVISLPADGSDSLVNVRIVEDKQEVLLITKKGQAVRFNSNNVRVMGRASYGVKGVELVKGDKVVSLVPVDNSGKESILTITEYGYGKRSALEDYRKTSRGGKGVINLKISDRTGEVVRAFPVIDKDSAILTTTKGIVIRIGMNALRVMGRITQGVRIVKLKTGDKVADAVKIPREEEVLDTEQ